jgi:nicotinamidase-related amidase
MARTIGKLPLPEHYQPANAFKPNFYPADVVQLQEQAIECREKHGLKDAGDDPIKIHLLVIDAQHDFSFPEGKLYVSGQSGSGAMQDQERLAAFIYHYLHLITEITCTMDTHLPYQIFHPIAHLDTDGKHPAPMTIISDEDYRHGKYHPNPAMASQLGVTSDWLQKQFLYYCEQLEASKKYQLTIWPYHCLLGSPGHRLVGVIQEARLFHSFARGAANRLELKGDNPLTEHYSIFRPEVMTLYNGKSIPHAAKNQKLLDTILGKDVVIIAGEAKSHCVAWSLEDLLLEILARDKKLARKIYILEDCTSPVVVPGVVDYTDIANKIFERFAEAGMHLVKSTDPIESWPGMGARLRAVS